MTTDPGPRRRPLASGQGFFALPDTCPDCGGTLRVATLDGAAVFVCTRCPAYWRCELGYLSRVDPPSAGPTRHGH